jgi:hypothetical protein
MHLQHLLGCVRALHESREKNQSCWAFLRLGPQGLEGPHGLEDRLRLPQGFSAWLVEFACALATGAATTADTASNTAATLSFFDFFMCLTFLFQ